MAHSWHWLHVQQLVQNKLLVHKWDTKQTRSQIRFSFKRAPFKRFAFLGTITEHFCVWTHLPSHNPLHTDKENSCDGKGSCKGTTWHEPWAFRGNQTPEHWSCYINRGDQYCRTMPQNQRRVGKRRKRTVGGTNRFPSQTQSHITSPHSLKLKCWTKLSYLFWLVSWSLFLHFCTKSSLQ